VQQLCSWSINLLKPQAYQKNIQLHYQIAPEIKTVDLDERRMRQVLINLLSNAIKFTPEGGTVKLEVTADLPAKIINFSVIDTGIGIAKENFNKLFQSFIQIDSSFSRRYAGTGLGLVLVHRLTQMHGGKVAVESELEVGTKFTVTIPFNSQFSPSSSDEKLELNCELENACPLNNSLIIIADKQEDYLNSLTDYLTAKSYNLIPVKTAQEAIALTQTKQTQLILIDLSLIDNLKIIQTIKNSSVTSTIPLITLANVAQFEDLSLTKTDSLRDRYLSLGVDEYIIKSTSLKNIFNIIQKKIFNP
jgi:CheY-like chemotaxis protein